MPPSTVDAVITSPPYMNALDYARDNRLRLWFLGVPDYRTIQSQELGGVCRFEASLLSVLHNLLRGIRNRGKCVLVLGDVGRSAHRRDLAQIVCETVAQAVKGLVLEDRNVERIPNGRRVRKSGGATKIETVLVFRVRK
jgi:DNA modification methylase